MKKNIFAFWLGDPKGRVKKNIEKLESLGFIVILGPTKKEDDYLIKKYKYYKDAKKAKLFSYCSDVWRFYKLSTSEGLYIDIDEIIGDNFHLLYDHISKYSGFAIKVTSHSISASFLYSTKKTQYIFKEMLDLYEKYEHGYVRCFTTSPIVVMFILKKYYSIGFSPEIILDNFMIGPYDLIRDKNSYRKEGNSSWTKIDPDKYTRKLHKNFVKGKRANALRRNLYNQKVFDGVDISRLRDQYDASTSKKELKKLKQIYKSVNRKLLLKERLFFSKLYRFFTFKFLKTK